MEQSTFNEYHKSISVIEARERLFELKKMDFAKSKKEDRERIHREISRAANPKELSNKKVLKTSELFGEMQKLGF